MAVDNWEHIINLMTGFTLGERKDIMGATGDGGIPWLAVDIKKKNREDLHLPDQWPHNDGSGWFIQFYTGHGNDLQKYEANVTYVDQTPGRQYWQRSSDALRTLVQPPYKSLGASSSYGGSPSLDTGVDLTSFTTAAKSFDRAGDFFNKHSEVLKQWTESLGDENAAWKGKAAGVFYDLINNLHDKYETFKTELTPPGFSPSHVSVDGGYPSTTLHGDSLITAQVALHTALSNMYDEFMRFISRSAQPILTTNPDGSQSTQIIDGDSRNVLTYLMTDVANWIRTHNISQVARHNYGTRGGGVRWTTGPAYSDTTVWGNLKDSSTWAAIANEALYRWRTNIETNLDVPARAEVATLQQTWSRVLNPGWNKAFAFEDKNPATLKEDLQEDKLESETGSGNDDLNKFGDDINKSLNDFGDNLNKSMNNLGDGLNNLGDDLNDSVTHLGDGLNNLGDDLGDGLNNFGDNLNNSLSNLGGDNGLGDPNTLSDLGGGTDNLSDPNTLSTLGSGGDDLATDAATLAAANLLNSGGTSNLTGGTNGLGDPTSITNPDGSVTTTNPDGSITTEYPDGSSTTISPSGEVTTTNPDGTVTTSQLAPGQSLLNPDGSTTSIDTNGDITTQFPDGSTVTHNADGSVTSIDPDGNKTTTFPNGVVETTTPDGLTQLTAPDGAVSVQNADGSLTTTYPDGTTTTVNPDGTVTTVNPNGSEITSHLADGQNLLNPDGSTTSIGSDGSITTTYPDGSSVTVNPDGTVTSTDADGSISDGLTGGTNGLGTSTPITTSADPSGLNLRNSDGSLSTTYPSGTSSLTDPSGYTTTTFPDGSSTIASPDGQFQAVPSPDTAANALATPAGSTGLTTTPAAGGDDLGLSSLSGLMSPMMMMMGMSRAGGQGGGQGQGERTRETYQDSDDDGTFLTHGMQRPTAAPPEEVFEEEDEDPVDLPSRTPTTGQGRRGSLGAQRPATEDSDWAEPDDVWGTGEEGLPASIGR
ncbi:AAWKG family protein [Streptomyces sp. NPDC001002]